MTRPFRRWPRAATAALALAATAFLPAATASAPVASATPGNASSFVWSGQTWNALSGGLAGKNSQAHTRLANVGIYSTGDLWISTMRHCLASGESVTESTPAHPTACPSGTTTTYSTGRIYADLPTSSLPSGADFAITFDAKPAKENPGTRSALWLQNADAYLGGCPANYGELDVLETYGSRTANADGKKKFDMTTWLTCSGGSLVQAGQTQDYITPGSRHTFAVRRVGKSITYQRDGATQGTHTCSLGAQCQTILGEPWRATIQSEVFGSGSFAKPDPAATFPTTTMIVYGFSVASLTPTAPGASWFLSDVFGGTGDHNFAYGAAGDVPLVGDWNGNGTFTPGVFRGGAWYLSDWFGGTGDHVLNFGVAGDVPVVGDWDGNGTFTPGVFRSGWWYLSNDFSGTTHLVFPFGDPGDVPVVGDWDGNGTFTPGVARSGWWYASNGFSGVTNLVFPFGDPGDVPVVGDWDGNGTSTPGVFRGSAWYLSNDFSGATHVAFNYGVGSDRPLTGDYDGNGTWTPGIHR